MLFPSYKVKNFLLSIVVLLFFFVSSNYGQRSIYQTVDLDTVKFSLQDLGRMWTFDDVPLDYFDKTYDFRPTEQWLEHVQKSALQFGGGCSAAFVSEDGLIMTNHHCVRGQFSQIQKEGENLLRDGFYAKTMDEERKIPGLYVDQLIFIEDVTDQVYDAMKRGNTNDEKVKLRDEKISELETTYSNDTGLLCKVVTLYNGGKFSLYGYKRYNDVRLVMAPDFQIAATGWDWDNFTYPRYELDFAFCRAYDENGNPVKSNDYFKWSKNGADTGDPVFVVGRPGSTNRLYAVSELEYYRDKTYPNLLLLFNEVYKVYFELFNAHPERESELLHGVLSWGNARKSYAGQLIGLRDDYIMAKKKDFEEQLKTKVHSDTELEKKYGHVWKSIEEATNELRKYTDEQMAYMIFNFAKPIYYKIAEGVVKYAEQMKLPEGEREPDYQADKINVTVDNLYPSEFDKELQDKLLRAHVNYVSGVLGKDNDLVKNMYNGLRNEEAVNYLLGRSMLTSKEKMKEFLKKNPDEILNSNDPFIYFLTHTRDKLKDLQSKTKELNNTLSVLNQMLGEIAFATFGTNFSPDATSTLRISDGRLKGYEYNGTIAPAKTTYYGLWDRYYSFGQHSYPWGLHPRWQNIPEGLDLSASICFASSNDIVGGNSGSSVINTKAEVVGVAHDGNMESLPGHIIFLPENNRTVASDSKGMLEALKLVYKTDRLVKELENGKVTK